MQDADVMILLFPEKAIGQEVERRGQANTANEQ